MDDVFIGADRSQPFHFEGRRGERRECPFCDWYLDQARPDLDLRQQLGAESNTIRIEWTDIEPIIEGHLRESHADEPEVIRAIEIIERRRTLARDIDPNREVPRAD